MGNLNLVCLPLILSMCFRLSVCLSVSAAFLGKLKLSISLSGLCSKRDSRLASYERDQPLLLFFPLLIWPPLLLACSLALPETLSSHLVLQVQQQLLPFPLWGSKKNSSSRSSHSSVNDNCKYYSCQQSRAERPGEARRWVRHIVTRTMSVVVLLLLQSNFSYYLHPSPDYNLRKPDRSFIGYVDRCV